MSHVAGWLNRAWCVVGILSLCLPIWALAGTTGKIAGTVKGPDGVPVPGVAISVQDTRLGATTDADGRYIILQVPPGEHTVTAQLVGYRTVSVTNVRISADLTSVVDLTVVEEAIEVQAVMVTAARPPIEKDVTSSQIIVDSRMVYNAPVARVLDYMAYEPGVSIGKTNEIRIREGGAEEVRFQVDNLDRTDPLTNKGLTQLNLTLVAEVTVLTGGFNAEYGNMRSGVVNAIYKDGSEHGWGLPWVSAVYSMSPARKKHFGPGAYDPQQYDYRLMADSALTGSGIDNLKPVYWPDLYEETRDDSALQAIKTKLPKVFDGWTARASALRLQGVFGKKYWRPDELREAWQWEANMNEQVWQYGNKPDWNIDLSIGQPLPGRLGGIVVGYSYAKAMTAVPAIRNYYSDRTVDAKLTLTPIDRLKIHLSALVGENRSTGAASEDGAKSSEELGQTGGGGVYGNDPIGLREPGELIGSVTGIGNDQNNKVNLAYNARLDGDYTQFGALLTYTFSPRTFMEMGVSQLNIEWNQPRPAPRADVDNFLGGWSSPKSYAWGGKNGFLDGPPGFPIYIWKRMPRYKYENGQYIAMGDSANYPTHPDQVRPENIIPRSPFDWDEPYPREDMLAVQKDADATFVTHTFTNFHKADGSLDTVTVVSPQGWYEQQTFDLSGRFNIGEDAKVAYRDKGTTLVFKGSLTHLVGVHTLKLGAEMTMSSVEVKWESVLPMMRGYSRTHNYTADPRIAGVYLQDKFESEGMIVNVGVRGDYFDAGSPVYTPDNIFDARYWKQGQMGQNILDSLLHKSPDSLLYQSRVWPLPPVTTLQPGKSYTFPEDPITPDELKALMPQRAADARFRMSPRVGISHPVSDRTKLFFNYGHFYNMPQGKFLHGFGSYEGPMGSGKASVRDVAYANLRPPKTTMYEVGVERVFPARVLLTVRGYAKFNTDQVSSVEVLPEKTLGGQDYSTYRNSNYEDIRGLEVKLSRATGRFLYGWATYNYVARRSGQAGLEQLFADPAKADTKWPADPVTSNSPDNFRSLLGLRTPAEWGVVTGGWNLSVVQTWVEGGEIVHNPQGLERRLLPEEYIMKNVDYWNTDLRLQKSLSLGGRRSLEAYLDVTNLWNTKRLAIGGTGYIEYIVDRRSRGGERNLRYGDESTWYVFTRPYQDAGGAWYQPIAPRLDWVQFLNPRAYRFGIRVNL